jgi:2-methylisocitrate lyase-like PEP mutase family enzyme
MRQAALAEQFRAMHTSTPILLLPNVWDAISARMIEAEGYRAIATTSSGLSWALGYQDGEKAPWSDVIAAVSRIVRVVSVPVTADIEAGYGATPEEVAAHVTDIIQAGAVGINLEDGERSLEDAASRIRAAHAAAQTVGVPIVINARTDLYLKHIGEDSTRLAAALERAAAFFAAGADCFFPFAVTDRETVAAFAARVRGPVNILGRPGTPEAAELQRLGVARVSTAGALPLIALNQVRAAVRSLRATGSFDALHTEMTRVDAQGLLE